MKRISENWSIMRVLKLLLGIMALGQALHQKDILLGIIAGLLLFTSVANLGCCGNHCAIDYNNNRKEMEKGYEEVDNKK